MPIKKNKPLRSVNNNAIYITMNIVQLKPKKDKKKKTYISFLNELILLIDNPDIFEISSLE